MIKHLQHSASIKNMQKNKHQAPSRYFTATMEGTTPLRNGKSCQENGIVRHKMVPYTPQHNGVAERKNRTLLNVARYMLKTGYMEQHFWEEAISTACYVQKRFPHRH